MTRRPTELDRLVEYIDRHGSITSPEAFNRLRITQLGRCIFNLKERGYEFATPRVKGTQLVAYRITKRPERPPLTLF